jgi:hypothetical protein
LIRGHLAEAAPDPRVKPVDDDLGSDRTSTNTALN